MERLPTGDRTKMKKLSFLVLLASFVAFMTKRRDNRLLRMAAGESVAEHTRCPRCRNTGFYLDNDAEGFKGRTNRVRCGCPAGDPELDA